MNVSQGRTHLKPLLEVMPEIEKVVNHRLTRLKNSS